MPLVIPNQFSPNTVADANAVNLNFTTIANYVNALPIAGLPTVITTSMATSGSGTFNQTALQNDINALFTAGGGALFIGAGTYNITGSVSIVGVPPKAGIVIFGASDATQIIQSNANSDTFVITGFSGGNGAGCQFRDLWFQYPDQASGTGIAVHISGGSQFVQCTGCYFQHCPQSFVTDANDGLFCGLRNCIIAQNNYSNPGVGQIDLGCTQGFVDSCLLRQNVGSYGSPPGPAGNIGIRTNGASVARITNCQISTFDYGVSIAGGSTNRIWISNSQIEASVTGLTIQPTVNTKSIYGVYVSNTDIKMSQTSTNTAATGVYIDTNGQANSQLQNVNFNDCSVYGWNGSGYTINQGEDINIVGGFCSSNGLNPASTLHGCGVTTGSGVSSPNEVHLIGVDFNGSYNFVSGTQPYALGFTASPIIRATGCIMIGQGTSPVFTTGLTGTPTVQLFNCAGYNDQGTVVSSAGISSASGFTLSSLGYYGPGTVYFSGTNTGLQVQIGSQTLYGTLANNSVGNYRIDSSAQSSTITWTGAPTLRIIGG